MNEWNKQINKRMALDKGLEFREPDVWNDFQDER